MAWTTRIIYIDGETAEVLNTEDIKIKKTWETYEKTTIYHKIHETHIERIIIHKCRRNQQQQLF